MSANEHYVPAFVGGAIRGVQINVENLGDNDKSCLARNGIYYVYQGQKFQLLSLSDVVVPSQTSKVISVELRDLVVPTTDIKIMVDTVDMTECVIIATILWSVAD